MTPEELKIKRLEKKVEDLESAKKLLEEDNQQLLARVDWEKDWRCRFQNFIKEAFMEAPTVKTY